MTSPRTEQEIEQDRLYRAYIRGWFRTTWSDDVPVGEPPSATAQSRAADAKHIVAPPSPASIRTVPQTKDVA